MGSNTTKSLRDVAKTFRQTKAGIQLGRIVFDPTLQTQISPAQITNLLRQAGIPIPKEVVVGLDVAQLISSGGAFISGIQAGASISQLANPAATSMKLTLEILSLCGLIDANSVAARTIQMGADLGMVISSGGTNVFADLALITDVVINAVFPPDDRPQVTQMLDKLNMDTALSWWKSRQTGQALASQKLLKDYADKKISIFELIGERAIQSGDSFMNYFPEYKVFIPPILMKQCFRSEQDANYGGFLFVDRKTEHIVREICFDFETIKVDRRFMQQVFVRKYINDPFAPYIFINSLKKSDLYLYGYPEKAREALKVKKVRNAPIYPRMNLSSLAVLSTLSKKFSRIEDNFDVKPVLRALRLTPKDFGSNVLEDHLRLNAYIRQENTYTQGFSINGVETAKAVIERNERVSADNYTLEKALQADEDGDISELLKDPRVSQIVTEWAVMPYVTPEMLDKLPYVYKVADKSLVVDYRNIQNYFSVFSVLSYLMKDPYFNDGQNFFDYVKGLFPSLDSMNDEFQELQFLSQARYLNALAQENVAFFFNTKPDKVNFEIKANGLGFVAPKR